MAEVRKMADAMDVKKFNDRAAKAVRERDFSQETNKFLKLYNLKERVSRLEVLKAELALEIQDLHANAFDLMDKERRDEQEKLIEHLKEQSGVLRISGSNIAMQMDKILNADFYGQSFAESVWGKNGLHGQMQKDVFASLNRIYTDMDGYKKERTYLSKKYDTSLSNADRLLKTEISRIQSQSAERIAKENGFTHYIYVAEPGACERCKPFDSVAIPIDELKQGVNLAPLHPRCRCSGYYQIKTKINDLSEFQEWSD
ncbi:hypothetical protein Javan633_0025 [Streptococcus phage Javan633]|nr:hypothetical protein Javan633_0025 [Streptococcus phage Javan633]QBX31269.1 hypothetical protein Javan628_0025 [Streptococcus phage Javan628]